MMARSSIPRSANTAMVWIRINCVPDIFAQKNGETPILPETIPVRMAQGKSFGDQNQILLRYAEILLNRAECKIRTGDVAGGHG